MEGRHFLSGDIAEFVDLQIYNYQEMSANGQLIEQYDCGTEPARNE